MGTTHTHTHGDTSNSPIPVPKLQQPTSSSHEPTHLTQSTCLTPAASLLVTKSPRRSPPTPRSPLSTRPRSPFPAPVTALHPPSSQRVTSLPPRRPPTPSAAALTMRKAKARASCSPSLTL